MKTMKKIKFSDIDGMLEKDGMREIIGGSGGGGTIGSGGQGSGPALSSNPFNGNYSGSNYGGFGGTNFGGGTTASAPNSQGVFGTNNPYGSSPMGAGTPYVNEQNELLYFAQAVSNGGTLIINGIKYIYDGLFTFKPSNSYPDSAGAGQLP